MSDRKARPLTERLDAARTVKQDAIARELLLLSVLTQARIWPAWISPPQTVQPSRGDFQLVLMIETRAGRLVYRLNEGERETLFAHLPTKPNDGAPCTGVDKFARLLELATEGWK